MNKRRMKEYLGLVLVASAMAHQQHEYYEEPEVNDDKKNRIVIPPGANYYHFGSQGGFEVWPEVPGWAVFSCIARSDKAAVKKYNKFINQ